MIDAELTDVPTVEDYKRALQAVYPIHQNHLALLRTHARAADQTLTATQLAEAVGYENYGAVNLQYGTFADKLCVHLNRDPETRLSVLVVFAKEGSDKAEHWKLILRPQIVQALNELGLS